MLALTVGHEVVALKVVGAPIAVVRGAGPFLGKKVAEPFSKVLNVRRGRIAAAGSLCGAFAKVRVLALGKHGPDVVPGGALEGGGEVRSSTPGGVFVGRPRGCFTPPSMRGRKMGKEARPIRVHGTLGHMHKRKRI